MYIVMQSGLPELIAGRAAGNPRSGQQHVVQRPGLPGTFFL
jgi:hypothetical protein